MTMLILSVDTSADETAAAVTQERRVIAHVEYTQIKTHSHWGGIVPSIAKRAHTERIDYVIEKTIRQASVRLGKPLTLEDFDYYAVTYGPGLAIALEVGIQKIKDLARRYDKRVIPVNHMEGHIYSVFAQNSSGVPLRPIEFPYLILLVSGGHTELVFMSGHGKYQILGQTRDDAAGEALDKAAKMLGFGYPGGPVIEQLSEEVQNVDIYNFPRPMIRSNNLDFSFSGLKTAFLYILKNMNSQQNLSNSRKLLSAFQEAVFDTLIKKTDVAIRQKRVASVAVGGGVSVNRRLRKLMRNLVHAYGGYAHFPPYKYLSGDNAAMIGVAAYYKALNNKILTNTDSLDRSPRLTLENDPFIS